MRRRPLILTAALAPWMFGVPHVGMAGTAEAAEPTAAAEAPKRILLLAGDNVRYVRLFRAFLEGLAKLRLLSAVPDRRKAETMRTLWEAVSRRGSSDRVRFMPEGCYGYGRRGGKGGLSALLERLETRGDADLILVFGTEATIDLAENVRDVPIMSLDSTDPVTTGVVVSEDDSGQENLHAVVTENHFARQVAILRSVRPIRQLGCVEAADRTLLSGVGYLRAACVEARIPFRLRTYEDHPGKSVEERFLAFEAGLESLLATGVDAVMLPAFPATDAQFARVVGRLVQKGVWSYSLAGPADVPRGMLLGAGEENLDAYGLFEAEAARRILEGETPREIPQRFVPQGRLLVNLRTAMQMGWQVPFGVLVSAEKAYTTQSVADLGGR